MLLLALLVVKARAATVSVLRSRETRQQHSLHRWLGTLRFFRHHPRQARSSIGRRERRKARAWIYIIRRELGETRASLRPKHPWSEAWYAQALCIHHREGAWNANTGNGFYGGMQFLLSTWRSVNGKGYPHQASPREQLYRAWLVWRRDGDSWSEWPTACG